MCCSARKKNFIFENGTNVYASDYPSAIVKLHETNTKNFTIENIGEYNWRCVFSSAVFIDFDSPSEFRARMHGPYLVYLDKKIT